MKRGKRTHSVHAICADAFSILHLRMIPLVFAAALLSSGCGAKGKDVGNQCRGVLLTAPDFASNGRSFTVAELMAHSSAMGMNQRDAETLIYLEGLSTSSTMQAGQTLCVDGKPDRP